MKKQKLLCILHRSPPSHGAAKVGDFIAQSISLKETFDCRFITIRSSDTIGDIGKINFKKIYFVFELYFKILCALILFRPHKIYFTASIRSVAFYRDLLLCTLWKTYNTFTSVELFCHYHTKGIDEFVSTSSKNLALTRFFLRNVNLILLSPMLRDDFKQVQTYKEIFFLPNGVEDNADDKAIEERSYEGKKHILYLSNMIKSKGYFEVLKLAMNTQREDVHFHFAGGWQNTEDEKEFLDLVSKSPLCDKVTFHGFISGEQKKALFEQSHLFIFPTRYQNEAFPLSILEALSYGLPVLSTDEGSIPYILDKKCGVIIHDLKNLAEGFEQALQTLINTQTARYCRVRYCENFTLQAFEKNLLNILGDQL
jgi:glycosyltransferase involved in cell wall biosynthesis